MKMERGRNSSLYVILLTFGFWVFGLGFYEVWDSVSVGSCIYRALYIS